MYLQHRPQQGLELFEADNGDMALTFAPEWGGRLLSARVHGVELLWQNPNLIGHDLGPARPVGEWPDNSAGMSTWANVGGSKTWPAPQGWAGPGEWPGPPDRVIDGGPWSTRSDWNELADTLEVTTTSAPDPRSGLKVVRLHRIPARGTTFELITTFINSSTRPVR